MHWKNGNLFGCGGSTLRIVKSCNLTIMIIIGMNTLPGQYYDIFRIYIDDIFQKHYKTNYCLVTNKFN